MKVVHISPYFAPAFRYGGPPQSILGLCKALQRAGVDVRVLTTTANGSGELEASTGENGAYDGVAVRYLSRARPRRLFGAAGLGGALATAFGGCDLVHVHGLWNVPVWAAARQARARQLPYIMSPRGMLDEGSRAYHAWRKWVAYHLIERRNLEGAALIHATSAAELHAVEAFGLGVPIVTVPNGVDPPPDTAGLRGTFRQQLDIDAGAAVITVLGRIHPIKRLDLVAAAFLRIRKRHPAARRGIAGPDERKHQRALEPLFEYVRDAVRWTGAVEQVDKWALLADTDVLLVASDSESFGMSVVEAMAAGVPVVVTKTCPWEEVEREGCGFWVDQQPEAIAAALSRLLEDPETARAMGARGRLLVRERYSWDAIGRAMKAHYTAVLAARGAAAPSA